MPWTCGCGIKGEIRSEDPSVCVSGDHPQIQEFWKDCIKISISRQVLSLPEFWCLFFRVFVEIFEKINSQPDIGGESTTLQPIFKFSCEAPYIMIYFVFNLHFVNSSAKISTARCKWMFNIVLQRLCILTCSDFEITSGEGKCKEIVQNYSFSVQWLAVHLQFCVWNINRLW